jgi:hypothetical protein
VCPWPPAHRRVPDGADPGGGGGQGVHGRHAVAGLLHSLPGGGSFFTWTPPGVINWMCFDCRIPCANPTQRWTGVTVGCLMVGLGIYGLTDGLAGCRNEEGEDSVGGGSSGGAVHIDSP